MSEQNQAIIIGGGIAGISSALSLAENGYHVHIIEKMGSVGGHAMQFCCKATEQCNNCGVCLAKERIKKVSYHPNIHILTHSEIVDLKGNAPDFQVEVLKKPRFIDYQKCTACSLCYQNCPIAEEAIERPYLYSVPNTFSIRKDKCLHFQKGKSCNICEESCPTGAIEFDQKEERINMKATAIILANGYKVYDAREKGYLGYNKFSEVITGLDLEKSLLMDGGKNFPIVPSDRKLRIAFIQCVGSRDPHIGHDYCSRVCCKYATRMGAKIKSRFDNVDLTIFYIDLQKTEREYLNLIKSLHDDIHFINGLPVEIEKDNDSGVSMRYENIDRGCLEKSDFDLVVLSVGICPSPDNRSLAELLGIRVGENGFFASPDLMDSTVSSRKGIFLAGTCQGPKNILESISHGREAALRTLALMKGPEGNG
ncbi:MAG: NAD(P)-binding protein [bacterium]